MDILVAHFDISSKLYQTYMTGVNIALKYNSVYTNAFQQVLKDIYKKMVKIKTITTNLMLSILSYMEKFMTSGSKIQIIIWINY